MLKEHGLALLPDKAFSNALKSNQQNKYGFEVNYYYKNYYCFEPDPDRRVYGAPKDQVKAMREELRETLKGGQEIQNHFFASEEERLQWMMPSVPENHFRNWREGRSAAVSAIAENGLN